MDLYSLVVDGDKAIGLTEEEAGQLHEVKRQASASNRSAAKAASPTFRRPTSPSASGFTSEGAAEQGAAPTVHVQGDEISVGRRDQCLA